MIDIDAKLHSMKSLPEIEDAAETLSAAQKQELLLFLAARLRHERQSVPQPRRFPLEQMWAWITEDGADLEHKSLSDAELEEIDSDFKSWRENRT